MIDTLALEIVSFLSLLIGILKIFFKGTSARTFFIFLIIILYVYIKYGLNKGGYEELVRRFKINFLILGGVAIFAVFSLSLRERIGQSIPYFIIYILSSIIQVRSIRHLESGMDGRTLKRINTRYLILISIFSVLAVVDTIRNFIFNIIGNIYDRIISVFLLAIYHPVNLVLRFIDHILGRMENQGENIELDASLEQGTAIMNQRGETPELLVSLISFLVSLLVIVLVIYIIYRVLRGLGNRAVQGTIDYSEEREYIRPKRQRRKLLKERFPKDYRDQIRYYYRRYLEKLQKVEIPIERGDTSLDIENKSKSKFPEAEEIRDIYIEARYKDQANKENVDKIKKAYKKL